MLSHATHMHTLQCGKTWGVQLAKRTGKGEESREEGGKHFGEDPSLQLMLHFTCFTHVYPALAP